MNADELIINTSLSESQIVQLIHYAISDPLLAKFTSDPIRFKDRTAFDKWMATEPFIRVLTNPAGDLLGIVWVQKENFPSAISTQLSPQEKNSYNATSGVRLYGDARGRGLGTWFYPKALSQFGNKPIWARVSADNTASIKLHEKLGFRLVSQPDFNNKVILVRHSSSD